MSNKLTALIVGVFATLALAAGTMQGCGSDNGSGSNVALCERVCDKSLTCTPDAGAAGEQARTMCKQNCATQVSTTHCTNESAIASTLNGCLDMACDPYVTCLLTVPACQGGTAGTNGGGGAGGGGGTGGGGSCDVCIKGDACCTALGGTNCNIKASCDAATGDARMTLIMTCQSGLDAVAGNPNAPAACR